jgi:hypothetical protein
LPRQQRVSHGHAAQRQHMAVRRASFDTILLPVVEVMIIHVHPHESTCMVSCSWSGNWVDWHPGSHSQPPTLYTGYTGTTAASPIHGSRQHAATHTTLNAMNTTLHMPGSPAPGWGCSRSDHHPKHGAPHRQASKPGRVACHTWRAPRQLPAAPGARGLP